MNESQGVTANNWEYSPARPSSHFHKWLAQGALEKSTIQPAEGMYRIKKIKIWIYILKIKTEPKFKTETLDPFPYIPSALEICIFTITNF